MTTRTGKRSAEPPPWLDESKNHPRIITCWGQGGADRISNIAEYVKNAAIAYTRDSFVFEEYPINKSLVLAQYLGQYDPNRASLNKNQIDITASYLFSLKCLEIHNHQAYMQLSMEESLQDLIITLWSDPNLIVLNLTVPLGYFPKKQSYDLYARLMERCKDRVVRFNVNIKNLQLYTAQGGPYQLVGLGPVVVWASEADQRQLDHHGHHLEEETAEAEVQEESARSRLMFAAFRQISSNQGMLRQSLRASQEDPAVVGALLAQDQRGLMRGDQRDPTESEENQASFWPAATSTPVRTGGSGLIKYADLAYPRQERRPGAAAQERERDNQATETSPALPVRVIELLQTVRSLFEDRTQQAVDTVGRRWVDAGTDRSVQDPELYMFLMNTYIKVLHSQAFSGLLHDSVARAFANKSPDSGLLRARLERDLSRLDNEELNRLPSQLRQVVLDTTTAADQLSNPQPAEVSARETGARPKGQNFRDPRTPQTGPQSRGSDPSNQTHEEKINDIMGAAKKNEMEELVRRQARLRRELLELDDEIQDKTETKTAGGRPETNQEREREDPNKIEVVDEETINLGENKEENHYQHVEEESEAEEVDPNDVTGRLPPLRRPKLN